MVSTHSRLKAAGITVGFRLPSGLVSTHSRLKAAGSGLSMFRLWRWSFNTQPPEGGWFQRGMGAIDNGSFNTQPPEGGWVVWTGCPVCQKLFQHTAA